MLDDRHIICLEQVRFECLINRRAKFLKVRVQDVDITIIVLGAGDKESLLSIWYGDSQEFVFDPREIGLR